MKKCGPWRRLKRPRRKLENCKIFRIRTTIKCLWSRGKSSSAKQGLNLRKKRCQGVRQRRNSKSFSETKTLETRSWQLLRRCENKRNRLNITCTGCARRTTIMPSSASSRSERPSLKVFKSKTTSSNKREPMLGTRWTWKLTRWLARSVLMRRRAWNWRGWKTSCSANFKRRRSRNVLLSNA